MNGLNYWYCKSSLDDKILKNWTTDKRIVLSRSDCEAPYWLVEEIVR